MSVAARSADGPTAPAQGIRLHHESPELARRHRIGQLFEWTCFGSTWFGIAVLAILLAGISWKAAGWLSLDLRRRFKSDFKLLCVSITGNGFFSVDCEATKYF